MLTTEEEPDDDVELASYDGVIASKFSKARGGTVSRVLVTLLAGDERCIKRRHKYGEKCGIDLPSIHSAARPSLAACLFRTSHSSLRRRAHADTAACDILCNLRNSKTQKSALPHGGQVLLYTCSGLHYSGLWRVGAPD